MLANVFEALRRMRKLNIDRKFFKATVFVLASLERASKDACTPVDFLQSVFLLCVLLKTKAKIIDISRLGESIK